MKITKEGTLNNKPIRFECSVCGCIFEINKDEGIKAGEYCDGFIYSCKCPYCGETEWTTAAKEEIS